jgi:dihydroorotate dehydrogenase
VPPRPAGPPTQLLYRLVRPLLLLLPAELAHRLGTALIRWLGARPRLRRFSRARLAPPLPELGSDRFGLRFENPIGLAAGFDKEGTAVSGLFALGFGFVEVGTLTPRAQPGNPSPRLFRVVQDRALVNRLGFNNPGAGAAAPGLERAHLWRPGPLGVNIGRNKDTPEERSIEDYRTAMTAVEEVSDYLVVNVSSPNTPGLRRLQEPERLRPLLRDLRDVSARLATTAGRPRRPLLVKVSPDLTDPALEELVDLLIEERVDGLIATNTTLARPLGTAGAYREEGGLSGGPLRERAEACTRVLAARSQGRLPIIGVGGILGPEDVYRRLRAGACLVQVYSGLIYRGPGFVGELCRGLASLLRRDGVRSLGEIVGIDLTRPPR